MIQNLPYDEIEYDNKVELEDLLKNEHNFDIGYKLEVDTNYPEAIKEKTKLFPFFPQKELSTQDMFRGLKKA